MGRRCRRRFARGFYCIERAAVDEYLLWVLVVLVVGRIDAVQRSISFFQRGERVQVQITMQIFGSENKTSVFRLLSSFC
jgi:hypothetical protein